MKTETKETMAFKGKPIRTKLHSSSVQNPPNPHGISPGEIVFHKACATTGKIRFLTPTR